MEICRREQGGGNIVKLKVKNNTIDLMVPTTDKELLHYELPTEKVHYWYPFNINFFYKYSMSKKFMYLVKEKDYDGENIYNVDILKRSKPLGERKGVMFHPYVYKRNRYIIEKARALGIPTVKDSYNLQDVQKGFSDLDLLIHAVKGRVEDRYIAHGGALEAPEVPSDDWDRAVYNVMTVEEQKVLQEFGEIYSMLTVMRKIAEGR